MAVFVAGAVAIVVSYIMIMGIGLYASFKWRKGESEKETMNAGGRFGLFVGTVTLVGTWAGGGYIVGSAEKIYDKGLIHVQAPIGYSVALLVGALFFIKPMRDGNFITMLDLFQLKYGKMYGATLIIPCLFAEFFWIASVLNSLGTALKVVLELEMWICVAVSALSAGLYTVFGGLVSVSYTDVAQLFLIVVGLLLVCPFAWLNEYTYLELSSERFWGKLKTNEISHYLDEYALICLGGIPWQGYFQRIFSIRSTKVAKQMSYIAFGALFLMAIPSLFVGVVALKTDWAYVPDWEKELTADHYVLVLPLVLRYLTPKWVAMLGLGAISGAVMSSADSAILASSALFSRNIYKQLIRKHASDRELHICLRITICIITALAGVLAVYVGRVYYLS